MVIAETIECPICSKKYLLRQQVDNSSNISDNPINVGCKCGYIFNGIFTQKNGLGFDFKDVETRSSYEEGTDSTIAVSAELPIPKELLYNTEIRGTFSPYMICSSYFDFTKIHEHVSHFMPLLEWLSNDLDNLKLIFNIYKNGDLNALNTVINKKYPDLLANEIKDINEARTAVLNLFIVPFGQISTPNYNNLFTKKIKDKIVDQIPTIKDKLTALDLELSKHYSLDDEFIRGMELLINYLEKSKEFIPITLLAYKDDFSYKYGTEFGITTTEYNEIKTLYSENFEFLSRLSSLIFGLINILDNGDHDIFDPSVSCPNLNGYMTLDNGLKKDKIAKHTFLNNYYLDTLNSQIRNGIGHLKTNYNSISQEIQYYPYKNQAKVHDHKSIHLIDFCFIIYQQILKVLESLIVLNHFKKNQ